MPLVALCAFGCGSSGSTAQDPAGTDPSSADGPACDTVWQADQALPRAYRGCVDASGALVPRDVLGCSSGQRLVSYGDRYYAVLGGTIREGSSPLADDPEYRAAVRSCRA
ncbi:hypothetical protein GCM10027062_25740 [Nocardioides hungaricus]